MKIDDLWVQIQKQM